MHRYTEEGSPVSHSITLRLRSRWLAVPLALAAMLAYSGYASGQVPGEQAPDGVITGPDGTALNVTVTASVVEASAPVTVEASPVTANAQGRGTHTVSVTWDGQTAAQLDDARFTHDAAADTGEGHLVIAGRGCGADWNEETEQVSHICILDFQQIVLQPGETHEYPVTIHPEVGPLALAPGTYTIEETIEWWPPNAELSARQSFTVRLDYTVTEEGAQPPPSTGLLTPEPAASGVSLASWAGGPADLLPPASSYWVTVDGRFFGYVMDAPQFANRSFLDQFPGGEIPAGTIMIVVR